MKLVTALLLAACGVAQAQNSIPLPDNATLSYAPHGTKTRFELRAGAGKPDVLDLARDATVPANASPTKVELLVAAPETAYVLADTYASRAGGMSNCQTGEERFLRVISIARQPARETLRIKLASCLDNIALATTRGIVWVPDRSTLHITWLQGPRQGGGQQIRSIKIGANGVPE